MNLDRDEQRIQSAFSQIQVDTQNLERKVRHHMRKNSRVMPPRRKLGAVMAFVMTIVLAAGTVYAATQGAFDRFIADQNPPFAEIVDPIEMYAKDQGIRMEVIGAQRFGGEAIVYVSLQDISGQNRLTEETWLWASSRFSMSRPRMLSFNENTNTAYFELILEDHQREVYLDFAFTDEDFSYGDGDTFTIELNPSNTNARISVAEVLELAITQIVFSRGETQDPFPVPLASISEAETMDFATLNSDINRILVPSGEGNFAALPRPGTSIAMLEGLDVNHRQWISNLAIMDGYLHVQLGSTRGALSSGMGLTTPDDTMVFPAGQEWFQVDENFQPIPGPFMISDTEDLPPYTFVELVFPIDATMLEHYTLTLFNSFQTGVEGHWAVSIDIDSASDQTRSWEGAANVGGIGNFVVESMLITPLSVRFTGSFEYTGAWITIGNEMSVETADGIVTLSPGTGLHAAAVPPTFNPNTETYEQGAWEFDIHSTAYSPIDVASVIAVIIDGVRIPMN